MRIYLVEDMESIREQIRVVLSQIQGAVVVGTAASAGEAIDGVRTLLPDVVVLDLGLKHSAGQDVLRELHPLLHRMRVVVFSNTVDQITVRHCLELGAVAVLDKSSQVEQLCDLIASFRGSKSMV